MKRSLGGVVFGVILWALGLGLAGALRAEHRATRLGFPSTRFADPLVAPEDIRWRFRDPELRKDIADVLRQAGWKGRLEDLFAAADKAPVVAWDIPVGYRMPFMSTRHNKKPVALIDVVWAGEKPEPAVYFDFVSLGRRYRCLTPMACSNFLVEDLGVQPKPGLEIACATRDMVLQNRPVKVCLTVRNPGDGPDSDVVVSLPVPAGATVTGLTADGAVNGGIVTWRLARLDAGASSELCATFGVDRLGPFQFEAVAKGAGTPQVSTTCDTTVRGVTGILLEVIDLEDPIEVGGSVTYIVKVMNQGTLADTKVAVRCLLPPSQEYISGSGTTEVQAEGRVVTLGTIPVLEAKTTAEWRLVIRAASEDDARFAVELRSDQFEEPLHENESTRQY